MIDINKYRLESCIDINKYRLEPGFVPTWGDVHGNIENQKDLIEYIKNHTTSLTPEQEALIDLIPEKADRSEIPSLDGYATESWVESKNYLTEHQDLSEYALKSEIPVVPSLDGYATESWVNNQGYLTEVPDEYAKKTDIPGPFKTINGESIVGEGDIEIQGGADLPDYIKDDHIEFTGEGDYEDTRLTDLGLIFNNKCGFGTVYEPSGFDIWNIDMELGINGAAEGFSASSGACGSIWMGTIWMPNAEEPDHYGLQVLNIEGTHISEFNNNGITFWDYDQTTEEGEIDWDNPTLTTISKEELMNIKGFNKDDYATKEYVDSIIGNLDDITNEILS